MTIAERIDKCEPDSRADLLYSDEIREQIAQEFDLITNFDSHLQMEEHNANIPDYVKTPNYRIDPTEDELYQFTDGSWYSGREGVVTEQRAQEMLKADTDMRRRCKHCVAVDPTLEPTV